MRQRDTQYLLATMMDLETTEGIHTGNQESVITCIIFILIIEIPLVSIIVENLREKSLDIRGHVRII